MHKNASAKYNAIKYDLERLRSIYTDTGGKIVNIDAQQAFLHFSGEIYGLHDWLIAESRIDQKVWEQFLSSSRFLFLMAKIATLDKHAAANATFWKTRYSDIRFNNHEMLIAPQGRSGNWITQGRYVVTADGVEYDGLELAEGALYELENFMHGQKIDLA